MNRRRFILGMFSLPAAAIAARLAPQLATGGVAPPTPKPMPRHVQAFLVSNPGYESWVRRKYLESPEYPSFETKYINVWVDANRS
jgi:hypothetical protein